jgi:hypothetical protein
MRGQSLAFFQRPRTPNYVAQVDFGHVCNSFRAKLIAYCRLNNFRNLAIIVFIARVGDVVRRSPPNRAHRWTTVYYRNVVYTAYNKMAKRVALRLLLLTGAEFFTNTTSATATPRGMQGLIHRE